MGEVTVKYYNGERKDMKVVFNGCDVEEIRRILALSSRDEIYESTGDKYEG